MASNSSLVSILFFNIIDSNKISALEVLLLRGTKILLLLINVQVCKGERQIVTFKSFGTAHWCG